MSHSISPAALRRYADAAERAKALVILDAIKRYHWALERPSVGITLDPEWRVA